MNYFLIEPNSLLTEGSHSPALVIVSIFIAMLASFAAFKVASIASSSTSSNRRNISLIVGSTALGGGVWSMHFIGMLAFDLCTNVDYSPSLTIVSLLPSVFASWIALHFLTKTTFSIMQLLTSGVLMGLGIGSMHYIGMASMEMAPLLRYDLSIFILSILVAAGLSCLSLWIKFGLKRGNSLGLSELSQTIVASVVMGAAISGMHYTGMAAARFVLPPGFETSSQGNDTSMYLALLISVITITSIVIVLITMMIFKYKDLTELASANEKRLAATINTSIDGIITINTHGIIVSANAAIEIMLGWTEEQLLGQNIKVIIPNKYGKHHDSYLTEYLKGKKANIIGSSRDLEAITQNGDTIPVRLGVGHVELSGEDLFVGFLSDLRSRHKMERALRDNESKFRSLISNIPGIVYRCIDIDERPMSYVSSEIADVTGYPLEDFLYPNPKRNFAQFVVQEDLDKILPEIQNAKVQFNIEYRIVDRYKQEKWMLGYGRKVLDSETGERFIDGFIMDITSRKRMEEALLIEKNKAQKAADTRAEFMANMSHEIRTPMNAIIGFSNVLLEESMTDIQLKYLNTIHDSANSLLHILNDILDSAKLDKGEMSLEILPFSLIETVDSVISSFGLQAKKKNVDLVLDLRASIPKQVLGASHRIRQVLVNLIGNAVKFTEKGEITVSLNSIYEELIEIEVADTGIGMSEAQSEKMFDPFTQADASMSRKYGGTGLGTTIAKQLVELMNGKISATSELGKGTKLSVILPLPASADITPQDKTTSYASELGTLSILIVDDVAQNIELLTLILTRNGHHVKSACNGQEALNYMQAEDFDVVLMDIQMPVLDGLTASLRRRDFERKNNLATLPIIALTASVLENDKLAAQRAGMNGFINKPIDPAKLYDEIAQVLNPELSIESTSKQDIQDPNRLVDLKRAVSLWGDARTLQVEIHRFLNNINLIPYFEKYQSRLISQDELASELHKAKGSAANLGLTDLSQTITSVEAALVSNDVNQQHISKLEISLSKVRTWLESGELNVNSTNVKDESSLQDLTNHLKALKEQIKHHNFNDEFLTKLTQSAPKEFAHKIELVAEYCNDFEFDKANIELDKLISQLT